MGVTSNEVNDGVLIYTNRPAQHVDKNDSADISRLERGHSSLNDLPMSNFSASKIDKSDDSAESLGTIDVTAETGVQAVQAAALVWTKRDLVLVYTFMWLVQFFMSFVNSTSATLTPFITSSFQQHSLTALTGVVSSIAGGLWKLSFAKIMNIWGRPHALCICVSFYTLGLALMASCNNVKTYCAGQVFYYTGYHCYNLFMTVFIADTVKLKNLGLFIGYAGSPWVIIPWVYGYAVNNIISPSGIGWRWCLGIFSIITPLVSAPLIFIVFANEAKARREGLIPPRQVDGSVAQKVRNYLHEFDAIGLLILATGLALFLLAFNLYARVADTWKSPMIICFLIFGGLLIIAFGMWEKFLATTTFIPWLLLKNRTVIFTYKTVASLGIAWSIRDAYFFSMLRVMFDLTIPHATYIDNVYTTGSTLIGLIYGLTLLKYGNLRIYSLVCGAPLIILGAGLMIKFCQPEENIGYTVMCMTFFAIGGGILSVSEQAILVAVSKQQDFPALLAVETMAAAIGNSIGSTIAGAIWTGVFPARLHANLPADTSKHFHSIYGDINVQTSFPVGSATRHAISLSYEQTMKDMLIAATCVYGITMFSIAMWQDVDVRTMKQKTSGLL